jgi:Ran GTPase-activating protein (RanGAP) involved in mRNA processing and transport
MTERCDQIPIDLYTSNFSMDKINYDTKNCIESSSPWGKLLSTLDNHEISGVDPDVLDKTPIMNVAKLFAERLKKDMKLLENKKEVTECAIVCPSWGTHYDKIFSICSFIAPLIFPKEDEKITDNDHEIAICSKFSKYLSKLRAAYRNQFKTYKDIETKFRQVPTVKGRKLFKELSKLPFLDTLEEPKWSPTMYSKPSDFNEIIEFIGNDTELDTKESSRHFKKGSIHRAATDDGYKLDLCDQGMNIETLKRLFDALKKNNIITHVLIGNNMFNDNGADIISDFIKNHTQKRKKKIATWYLCACGFTAVGMKKICDVIALDPDIKGLWLKRNPLKVAGNKIVADLIKTNKTIKVLDLINTALKDEGCEYLFDALRENEAIESLYIGINCLTTKSAEYISKYFDFLSENKLDRIKHIYLEVNRLDDDGIIKICKSLNNYKHITKIGFGSNRISHIGAKTVFDTFVDRKNLEFLDLGMCKATIPAHELPNNITDLGIDDVCEFIENNKSVRLLNIQHNGFTDESIDKLVDSYEKNDSILKISCEQAGCKKLSRSSKLFVLMNERIKNKYNIDEREFSKDLSRVLCTGEYIRDSSSIYFNGR